MDFLRIRSDVRQASRVRQMLAAVIVAAVVMPMLAASQAVPAPDAIPSFTLQECIDYALRHQPGLNQSLIHRSVVKTANAIDISGWLPHLTLSGTALHYTQLPAAAAPLSGSSGGPPTATRTSAANTAILELSASQTIFDPELLHAAVTAPLNVRLAEQGIDSARINVVSSVSKAFYNLLLTLEQINVLKEDTARLGRTVLDTYHQYHGGIVDETDYEQAVITLNNSRAQLNQQMEDVAPGYAALKQIMGYSPAEPIQVTYDTTQMVREVAFDTTQLLQYEKRIEYQELQTTKALQHQQTVYYGLSFLPTVSAVFNYDHAYQSSTTSMLFRDGYPYSYIGLSLSLPIFTGFSRLENLHRSKLEEEILDWSEVNLKSAIYTEYRNALGAYKSSLYNWHLLNENKARAQNVYHIVSLQYSQGIVAYLNMIVAESNLLTAEIGYLDALFQLLSSKIDLQKAMGGIMLTP
jgi:outer membrane protein TolC